VAKQPVKITNTSPVKITDLKGILAVK
jgi:hypothetical protein